MHPITQHSLCDVAAAALKLDHLESYESIGNQRLKYSLLNRTSGVACRKCKLEWATSNTPEYATSNTPEGCYLHTDTANRGKGPATSNGTITHHPICTRRESDICTYRTHATHCVPRDKALSWFSGVRSSECHLAILFGHSQRHTATGWPVVTTNLAIRPPTCSRRFASPQLPCKRRGAAPNSPHFAHLCRTLATFCCSPIAFCTTTHTPVGLQDPRWRNTSCLVLVLRQMGAGVQMHAPREPPK